MRGKLGLCRTHGVHLERGDEIRIEGHQSNVLLDGEMFEAETERPIRAPADGADAVFAAIRLEHVGIEAVDPTGQRGAASQGKETSYKNRFL